MFLPPRLLVPLFVLSACGPGQYLVLPGAQLVPFDSIEQTTETAQVPTFAVAAGDPALAAGDSVTINVNFTTVTEVVITQLVIMSALTEVWVFELTDEELEAGSVDLEFEAVTEKPSEEDCHIPYHQQGYCAQDADEGISETPILWAANEETMSAAALLPITLEPWETGSTGDACFDFTVDDCCGGASGIEAVECVIDDTCDCPNGTYQDIYAADAGTHTCTCP